MWRVAVLATAVLQPSAQLLLDGSPAPEELVLEVAKGVELALRGDYFLHTVGAERADQLVLEILDADKSRIAEHAPEPPLLAEVAQSGDPLALVLRGRSPDRLRAADGDDLDPLEVQAEPPGHCLEGDPVGDPFDEDDGHGRDASLRNMATGGYLLQLGEVPYLEAWELQRSLAGAVSQGAIPDTVVLLEHPPVVTLGRRTDETAELHVPEDAEVEVVETDRGGKSTFHGPGQLVCYPILDLKRHGRDVEQYVRNLEEALIGTLVPLGVAGTRLEGLTGVWLERPPRKIASIGVHVSRWVTTHGYALNVDLDPAPFTDWITACGLEDAMFTTIARELSRPVTVDDVRPHAVAALEDIFGFELEELPAEDGAGLWPQPLHEQLAAG